MDRFTFAASAAVDGNTLSGVAHAFGERTKMGGHYVEFEPTSFDRALKTSDARSFINHDPNMLLGRQSSGTLALEAKPDGLHYNIDLPATSYAADLKALIARGDLNEMSFGVVPGKHSTYRAADGTQVWRYGEVSEFLDVSPVAMPAFSGTSVQLHSLTDGDETPRSQAVKARHRAYTEEI